MKLKLMLSLAVILLLTSCVEVKKSDPLIEDGVVLQTILRPYHMHDYYTPETHTDSEGHVTVRIEHHTDYYYEQHWVVFACQHGEFAINNKDVWAKLNPGMRVKIRYRQLDMYSKKKGQTVHVGTDFEFEDAWPVDSEWNVNNVKVKK